MSSARAWGDEDDDELPEKYVSPVDENGIKTIIEYGLNTLGQKVKYTKKIKVVETVTKVAKVVAARKARLANKKFGDAKDVADESNVTIIDYNETYMTRPGEEHDSTPAGLRDAMEGFGKKLMWRNLQRKYGLDDGDPSVPPPPMDDDDEGGGRPGGDDSGGLGGLSSLGGGKSAYVPPSMRAGAAAPSAGAGGSGLARMEAAAGSSAFEDRDLATLRVTNISEDTTEADLQDLFNQFGRISRIYLAKDRETMQSRGFAFVSFHRRDDAQGAMEKLNGYGYDHLILKIEWAKPSNPKDVQATGLGGGFTSGYGKALAQDTDLKVAFQSNLTENR